MHCSPPGSSVHGTFQARIPEWVATSLSRDSCGCQSLLKATECQFARSYMLDDFCLPWPSVFHFPEEKSVFCGWLSSPHDVQLWGMTEVWSVPSLWFHVITWLVCLCCLSGHSESTVHQSCLEMGFFFSFFLLHCLHSLYRIWTDQINRIGAYPLACN